MNNDQRSDRYPTNVPCWHKSKEMLKRLAHLRGQSISGLIDGLIRDAVSKIKPDREIDPDAARELRAFMFRK